MIHTTTTITCDGDKCTHERSKDSNHWLVGMFVLGQILLTTSRSAIALTDQSGNPVCAIPMELVKDFCGEECAVKWVSKMLTEIKK